MKTYLDILRDRRRVLQNPYAYADELDQLQAIRLDRIRLENPYAHAEEVSARSGPIARFDGIGESITVPKSVTPRKKRSDLELERFVRDLQLDLWTRRKQLFGSDDLDPVDVLDPETALRELGYRVAESDSLGQHADSLGVFEIAGMIDQGRRLVQISRQFPRSVQAFTLAHELAHAHLHHSIVMHRDRPLDGTGAALRDPDEREANRFATLFLMPERQVQRHFSSLFGAGPVRFDERATFGSKVPKWFDVRREASKRLASMDTYNGVPSTSLSNRFRVSIEAMAIRLEELRLFELSGNLRPGQK